MHNIVFLQPKRSLILKAATSLQFYWRETCSSPAHLRLKDKLHSNVWNFPHSSFVSAKEIPPFFFLNLCILQYKITAKNPVVLFLYSLEERSFVSLQSQHNVVNLLFMVQVFSVQQFPSNHGRAASASVAGRANAEALGAYWQATFQLAHPSLRLGAGTRHQTGAPGCTLEGMGTRQWRWRSPGRGEGSKQRSRVQYGCSSSDLCLNWWNADLLKHRHYWESHLLVLYWSYLYWIMLRFL